MASPLRLTLGRSERFAPDPEVGRAGWEGVVGSFETSEQAMSRFRESSELTILNWTAGSGRPCRPSARLRQALVATDRAHRVTQGRFDPRVLTDLDRLGYVGAPLEVGTGRTIASRPDRASGIIRRIGRDEIALDWPIDLGGIGKGLGLRWATAGLERAGLTDFLLEAGGDLVARGLDAAASPWLIGLEDPTESRDALAVIAVTNGAVATSSVRVHRWSVGGREVHHLIDPGTGESADGGLASVTVAGPDPAWAEVWSKVLFISGRATIAAEARSRGLAAWWVADDGSLEMTPDARRRTVWVAAEDDPDGSTMPPRPSTSDTA